jgi:hypothetical protein
MSVEVIPVEGLPIVRPGDDIAAMLTEPVRALGARDGDVVVVTQKIVSKAEGRVVPDDDRAAWVERETERVVGGGGGGARAPPPPPPPPPPPTASSARTRGSMHPTSRTAG